MSKKIVAWFSKLSALLSTKQSQFLLFGIATVVSLLLHGYHMGTFDQASHIPFLKKNVDSTLYPNDPYFDLRNSHYSFFWLFFIPFYRLGILEPSMFIVYCVVLFMTFWSLWKLSYRLFSHRLVSFLSVLVFTFPHFGFAGFPLIEFSLLNRTFSLPFLILAVTWYLENKQTRSILLLGILYNIHAVSVHFVLAMFFFDILGNFRKYGIRHIVSLGMVFIVGALPVLTWKFSSPGDSHILAINWYWYRTIADGVLGNIFYTLNTSIPQIMLVTLCGLGTYALFVNSFFLSCSQQPHKKTVQYFFLGMTFVLMLQLVSSYLIPVTILIQAQIIRVGTFLLIFSYFYFLHVLVIRFETKQIHSATFLFFVIAAIIIPAPFILFFIVFLFRNNIGWKTRTALYTFVFVFLISVMVISYSQRLWYQGIYIYPRHTPLFDVQMWAKKNTPKSATFLVPPYLWDFYDVEWRVISERSAFVTLSELLEAAFEPNYLKSWTSRFDLVAPDVRKQFKGDFFANKEKIRKIFLHLSQAQIKTIAQNNTLDYFVTEKGGAVFSFPVVYQNSSFIVYDLRSQRKSN